MTQILKDLLVSHYKQANNARCLEKWLARYWYHSSWFIIYLMKTFSVQETLFFFSKIVVMKDHSIEGALNL